MVKIKGIVKTAALAKSQIQQGITPQDIDSFKKFVINSLKTIEQICDKEQTSPNNLPSRSRKAYNYLKQIDLQNLPLNNDICEATTVKSISSPSLGIKNILNQEKNIQNQIRQLAPNYNVSQLEKITRILNNNVGEIESLCEQNKVTPSALTTTSRKVYAWMKFLGNQDNLKLHIATIHKIQKIVHKTLKIKKLDALEIEIAIANFNNLYKYKKYSQGKIQLRLNEGFIQAEDKILQGIIDIIVGESNPETRKLISDYGLTEEYSNIILELDLIAEIDAETSQGNYYDLEALFCAINQEYFEEKMAKPRLTWNKILTHRKLGHYEPLRDRVVMSKTLDSPNVPKIVVELVLYHELLHKHHGAKWLNGKRMVHTPEFRRNERKFKHYEVAQTWLENFSILGM